MDGSVVADLKTVVAPLNFLVPMAEKPVSYNYEPPQGTPQRTGRNVEYQVTIRDARPLIDQLSLDKEGFVLLRHQSAVKNFYDEDEIKSVYYPECERVMKEATGAVRVVAFDHIVRNAAMAGPYLAEKYRTYAAWGQDEVLPGDDTFHQPFEALLRDRFVLGSPEECYEQLRPCWEEAGANFLIFRTHWSGMPVGHALASMRLISDELLPALRRIVPAAGNS